ncbi:MAG: exodeoxyribonuclease VII large subunit [Planctomycetota bacterium]
MRYPTAIMASLFPDPPLQDSQTAPPDPLTVSELTLAIKTLLQSAFPTVWVLGEVSDVARPRSGHIYLTLKDASAQIRAVIWRSDAQRLKFPVEDGTEVLCAGSIDLYAPRGSYQLVIRRMEPRGAGALEQALRRLQAKLDAEGLFDPQRKQPLPLFPRRAALVTSPSGAALRDFLEVARRRWSACQLTVVPCAVQGEAAVPEIVDAVAATTRLDPPPDVVVVTRGGGSMEDLWCFNSERVVRAIHACPFPVISAIGHEIDVTLADRVADVRALTPSEAAERLLPDQDEIEARIKSLHDRLSSGVRRLVQHGRQRAELLLARPVLRSPLDRLHDLARRLDELEARTHRAIRLKVQRDRDRLSGRSAQLEALSPLRVLARGYSYTQREDDGQIISHTDQLSEGSRVMTTLDNGRFVSTVDQIIDVPSSSPKSKS